MFKLEIDTSNDAFAGSAETERGEIAREPMRSRSLISTGFVDVSNIQEYGLTQKLSNSIRCF